MIEVVFLVSLALIWMIFASLQDLKKNIVANWLNFSLIAFALGFRLFYSLFSADFNFLYQGLIGFGIFFLIGNALYYGRVFAGGDAKLMIALGAILPLSDSFIINAKIFLIFFILFLFAGAFYGLIWSFFLTAKNFREFKKETGKFFGIYGKIYALITIFAIILLAFGFFVNPLLIYSSILVFIFPWLHLYAKAVDESCMIKNIKTKDLEEGDWLYKDVKIKGRTIRESWDGLSKKEILEIKRKHKEIKIRKGIPFVPVFLISFLILIYIYFFNSEMINLWLGF